VVDLQTVSGALANVALLLGAIGAGIKFRLFNLLGHRWHSDLECAHYILPDGSIVFTADYTVTNRGQRPLHLRTVTMRVVGTRREGRLLLPDEAEVLASRTHRISEPGLRGNSQIEPTERSIYTIRAVLPQLPDVVFVMCTLEPETKRPPSEFRGFYCRWPAVQHSQLHPGAPPLSPETT
jgi:hypothetical protein